jgi:hypothetical protein
LKLTWEYGAHIGADFLSRFLTKKEKIKRNFYKKSYEFLFSILACPKRLDSFKNKKDRG